MPNQKIDIDTDGDPETIYEDTEAHERKGFREEDTKQILYDDVNDAIEIEY